MLIEAVSQTTAGHVYILTGNDDLNVGAGVVIQSDTTDTVTMWQGQHTITVSGTIIGTDDGINTIGCDPAQNIQILAGGSIIAGIMGTLPDPVVDACAIIVDGLNSVVVNHGSLTATGAGVTLFVRIGGTTTVTNHGTIFGQTAGVDHRFGEGTMHLINTGTIESPGAAFKGNPYVDIVTNTGTLIGTVVLGGGDDLYEGYGGLVTGLIDGGDGNDRFVLGRGIDHIDGGAGIDTLDFTDAVLATTLDLSDASHNLGGLVRGDTLTGIENILGSARRDALTGDAQNNLLAGGAAIDTLSGGSGDDTLVGGLGHDSLSGGDGADVFLFTQTQGLADVITDFISGTDHFGIDAAAFGFAGPGALMAEAFRASTIARAQDADDRFMFRTTDATLWFDADGNGTGSTQIRVATLQPGAMVDVLDFLLL